MLIPGRAMGLHRRTLPRVRELKLLSPILNTPLKAVAPPPEVRELNHCRYPSGLFRYASNHTSMFQGYRSYSLKAFPR